MEGELGPFMTSEAGDILLLFLQCWGTPKQSLLKAKQALNTEPQVVSSPDRALRLLEHSG